MLCSQCSEVVRPVVAIDIDGTLGLYHEHFHSFASQYLGRTLPQEFPGGMPFWQYLGLDLVTYRKVKLAYRQGGMKRSMPVREGAQYLFRVARDLDAEIWITTTRPYLRLDNIDPDTQNWLERNDLHADFMLYDEDKYGQLHDRVGSERVVAVVDDLAEQWDRASEVFGHEVPIMAYRTHNISERRYHGWGSLYQIANQIQKRILVWKEVTG